MVLTNDAGDVIYAMFLGGHRVGKPPVPAGSRLICPEGHLVATASVDLRDGDAWGAAFEFVGSPVETGTPREDCRCPHCGGIWLWPEPTQLND